MEHLEGPHLISLAHPRQMEALNREAKSHLTACPQCRRFALECDALRVLALEASANADKALVRQSLQGVRRIQVAERLSEQAGDSAAREILLAHARRKPGSIFPPRRTALLYAGAVLACAVGLFMLNRGLSDKVSGALSGKSPEKPLPFEFQPGEKKQGLAVQPALSADEQGEENMLERVSRKLLRTWYRQGKRRKPEKNLSVQPVTPVPARIPAGPGDYAFTLSRARLSLNRCEALDLTARRPESGSLELRLLDASGRSVRLLANGPYGAGMLTFRFDCKSDSGKAIKPGTYYFRAVTRWFSRVEPVVFEP